MDKEFMKILEKIEKIVDKIGGNKQQKDKITEAIKEKCTISLVKEEGANERNVHVEGTTIAILLNLAGLEKEILRQLDVPPMMFEMLKRNIGVEEANNE